MPAAGRGSETRAIVRRLLETLMPVSREVRPPYHTPAQLGRARWPSGESQRGGPARLPDPDLGIQSRCEARASSSWSRARQSQGVPPCVCTSTTLAGHRRWRRREPFGIRFPHRGRGPRGRTRSQTPSLTRSAHSPVEQRPILCLGHRDRHEHARSRPARHFGVGMKKPPASRGAAAARTADQPITDRPLHRAPGKRAPRRIWDPRSQTAARRP